MKHFPILISIILIISFSCEKSIESPDKIDVEKKTILNEKLINELNIAINSIAKIQDVILTHGDLKDTKNTLLSAEKCPDIEYSESKEYPKVLTVDFNSLCLYNLRNIYRGKINCDISGPIRSAGSEIISFFGNLEIDDNAIFGEIITTVISNHLENEGYIELNSNISYLSFRTDESSFSIEGDLEYKWYVNEEEVDNHQFTITSLNLEGSNSDGSNYMTELDNIIKFGPDCKEPISGLIHISNSDNIFPASIHYGNEICDRKATAKSILKTETNEGIKENEHTYEISVF